MSEVICNTSPFQYLYQIELLHILPALVKHIIVPPAVVEELAVGRKLGIHLPNPSALNWVSVRQPNSMLALPLVTDLGPGETEVLMLALESPNAIVILDDALARRIAEMLHINVTGTLGMLLDAKNAGLIQMLEPQLDRLQQLGFHLALQTRAAVLKLAGE